VKRDNYNYTYGRRSAWFNFAWGLVAGAGMGAWISWGLIDSRWTFITLTAAIGLTVAACCALWGEMAWEKVAGLFSLIADLSWW
jgi:hypothetical protein